MLARYIYNDLQSSFFHHFGLKGVPHTGVVILTSGIGYIGYIWTAQSAEGDCVI